MPNTQPVFLEGWYQEAVESAKETVKNFSDSDQSWATNIQESIRESAPSSEKMPRNIPITEPPASSD